MADSTSAAPPSTSSAPPSETPAAAPTGAVAESTGGAPPAETKAEIRRLKLALEGLGEVEMPESDVVQLAQQVAKVSATDRAALLRVQEMERMLKKDPVKFMQEAGLDFDKLAEQRLSELYQAQLDEAKLSPAEKELKALKKQMAQREAEAQEREEASRKTEAEKQTAAMREHYTKLIDSALKETTLPTTESTVKRMAQLMLRNEELGLEIPAPMLAKLVEQEVAQEHDAIFGKMEDEKLLDRLTEKRFEKLLRIYANRKKIAPPAPKAETQPESKAPTKSKWITESEFKKMNKSKLTDKFRRSNE